MIDPPPGRYVPPLKTAADTPAKGGKGTLIGLALALVAGALVIAFLARPQHAEGAPPPEPAAVSTTNTPAPAVSTPAPPPEEPTYQPPPEPEVILRLPPAAWLLIEVLDEHPERLTREELLSLYEILEPMRAETAEELTTLLAKHAAMDDAAWAAYDAAPDGPARERQFAKAEVPMDALYERIQPIARRAHVLTNRTDQIKAIFKERGADAH